MSLVNCSDIILPNKYYNSNTTNKNTHDGRCALILNVARLKYSLFDCDKI